MFKDSLGKLTQKQDLTAQELTEFVEAMRDDQVTDVQIAGFLVALLMKGPTVDEVAAIARAMRENCVQIEPKVSGNLTDMCGTGGGLTTFNVSYGQRHPHRLGRRAGGQARQPVHLGQLRQRRRPRGPRRRRPSSPPTRAAS